MRVGLNLPQYAIDFASGRADAAEALRLACLAEDLGLDSVWLSDHPFVVAPDGSVSGALEPLVLAASLMRRTRRVEVGTLVLAASMRSPATLAHAGHTLDANRFVLGVGAGWYEPEHTAYGIELGPFRARAARLVETVRRATANGPPRSRVLVGGVGATARSVAARFADAWNCAWDPPPDAYRTLCRDLDERCADTGRDPSELRRSVGVTVLVAEDEAGLRDAVARLRSRAAFLRDVTLGALRERIVVGTPDECAARIAAYGADEVVVTMVLRDDHDAVRLLARDVAPALRETAARSA